MTERARRVLALSETETQSLGHNAIEPGHILLALSAEGEGVAAKVLERLGVSTDEIRRSVADMYGPPVRTRTHPTFSEASDMVIAASIGETKRFGHHYIGTEHLLLAVARSPDVPKSTLERLGVSADSITQKINDILAPRPRVVGRWLSGLDAETIWNSSLAYRDREQAVDLVSKNPTYAAKEMVVSPIFRKREIEVQSDLCFVLMPFKPKFTPVMRRIARAAKSARLKALRADNIFGPEEIMEQIWSEINRARLIVADVTYKNPNVFYELGIAHTVGKPVIMITQRRADVPFDLSHIRYIHYRTDSPGLAQLTGNLRKAMKSVLDQSSD